VNAAPLSILLLYDCVYPESVGGVQHRNLEIARELGRRGHRVTIGGWTSHPRRLDDRVCVISLPFVTPIYGSNGKRSVLASVRYALACLTLPIRQYDVIETANIPYIHLIPLALRCFLHRRTLIVTWHEFWGEYWPRYVSPPKAWLYAAIERMVAHIGTRAVAVSRLTADRVQQQRRGSEEVARIPCGLDLNRIQAATAGVVRSRNRLIYAGRLAVDKRLPLLIRAMGILKQSDPSIRLAIVGVGPDRADLEQLAVEAGVSDCLEFAGSLQSADEVWREIARARIAVTASSREGFGMFPLEAMACATPVVYCDSPDSALSEIIPVGRCGLMAEATPDSIAQTIRRLLEDDCLWRQMSSNATTDVKMYQWETIAEQTEKVLYAALRTC
jgi:glycosyltransferase involved in cell wall biosynthesis